MSGFLKWVPGIEFRSSGLPGKHIYLLSHLTGPRVGWLVGLLTIRRVETDFAYLFSLFASRGNRRMRLSLLKSVGNYRAIRKPT